MTENKEKQPRIRIGFILFWIVAGLLAAFYVHIIFFPRSPFLPRDASYKPFERHYHFSARFPFVTSYFLMLPKDYDPEKRYPLVMLLHGVSRHMAAGKALKMRDRRKAYPFIVFIPIAPPAHHWAVPGKIKIIPEALPLAMDALESIKNEYSVDASRIYVSGFSMGGVGTYAALARYHNVFAAAAPVAAVWDPRDVPNMDHVPVWSFQGALDEYAHLNRVMIEDMRKEGMDVKFTDYPNKAHYIWDEVYRDDALWDWMMAQKR